MAKVGEGWVAETELLYVIRRAFPDVKVVHHARPEWLGRQHIDIYIEDYRLAIEYQGAQHYTPIEFFGGEEALRLTEARDRRKRHLCEINGIELVYVEENYAKQNLIDLINRRILEFQRNRTENSENGE